MDDLLNLKLKKMKTVTESAKRRAGYILIYPKLMIRELQHPCVHYKKPPLLGKNYKKLALSYFGLQNQPSYHMPLVVQ